MKADISWRTHTEANAGQNIFVAPFSAQRPAPKSPATAQAVRRVLLGNLYCSYLQALNRGQVPRAWGQKPLLSFHRLPPEWRGEWQTLIAEFRVAAQNGSPGANMTIDWINMFVGKAEEEIPRTQSLSCPSEKN